MGKRILVLPVPGSVISGGPGFKVLGGKENTFISCYDSDRSFLLSVDFFKTASR